MSLVSRSREILRFVAVLGVVVGASSACKDKTKDAAQQKEERKEAAAQVEGLGAFPADVRVVVGADVRKLAASSLVRRAFASMVARDPKLGEQLTALSSKCKLDPEKDLEQVLVGLLGTTTSRDVVMVAKGKFDENAIVDCVSSSLADKGGSLDKKPADGGVTIYVARNPGAGGDVVFSFGAKGTILLADSEALLVRARDAKTPRLTADADMMKLIGSTDTRAALWGVGVVAPEVGRGITEATGGEVKQPAKAMWGHLEPKDGLAVELAMLMASPEDAKALAATAQKQITQYAVLAQAYSLGAMVHKIKTEAKDDVFVISLALDAGELARLETLFDRKTPPPSGTESQGQEGATP